MKKSKNTTCVFAMLTAMFHFLMMTSRFDLPVMTSDFELAVMTSMFDVALMTSVFVDLVTSMNSFVKNSLLLIVLLTMSKASLV